VRMTIEERIADRVMTEVARVFKKNVNELNRNTRFIEDLHAKSVDIVELIAVLENEFGVEIPYPETRRRKTIGEAIELVVSLRTR
jgi:acyl carrier protein